VEAPTVSLDLDQACLNTRDARLDRVGSWVVSNQGKETGVAPWPWPTPPLLHGQGTERFADDVAPEPFQLDEVKQQGILQQPQVVIQQSSDDGNARRMIH
jgi:hypothetical protein